MMESFQRLRLVWVVLLGLLVATTGSFVAVRGYDAAESEFIAARGDRLFSTISENQA